MIFIRKKKYNCTYWLNIVLITEINIKFEISIFKQKDTLCIFKECQLIIYIYIYLVFSKLLLQYLFWLIILNFEVLDSSFKQF